MRSSNLVIFFAVFVTWTATLAAKTSEHKTYTSSYEQKLDEALSLFNEGLYKESVDAYSKVLSIAPNDSGALMMRGYAQLMQGKHELAIGDLQKSIELNPKSAANHFTLGIALIGAGRNNQAVESLTRAIKIYPGYAEAYHQRGNAYNHINVPLKAISDYKRFLALKPNDGTVLEKLGKTLLNRTKAKEGGCMALKQACGNGRCIEYQKVKTFCGQR